MDLGGFDQTIGSLGGSITTSTGGGTITNSGSSGLNTLTIGGASSFAGTIQDGLSAKTALTVTGPAVMLGGTNTYTGGTTINAGGMLELAFIGGLSGSVVGNITDNGTLIFAHGTSIASGLISGTGSVIQAGGSTTEIFTANNTYTGGTTIEPGSTLQLGNGGTSGSIVGNVDNLGTLIFDRSDAFTFAGAIGNVTGSMQQIGTGSLTLSGISGYDGPTSVNTGTLNVTGSIANSRLITVGSGATLTGNGTVGNVLIDSGGTFTPGTAGTPGTATTIAMAGTPGTIANNLAFQSGALYVVYLNPTASTSAKVAGTASLAGTVNAMFAPGSYLTKQYIILQSAGLNGKFSGLTTTGLPSGASVSLAYTSNDVLLDLALSLPTTGLNVNQRNVADTINNFFNGGGAIPPGFASLFTLTGAPLGNALTQLDGEAATDARRGVFQMNDQFLGLMLDPFVDGRSGAGWPTASNVPPARSFAPEQETGLPPDIALAYAAMLTKAPPQQMFEQRWSAWGAGFGGSSTANGDPVIGSNNVTASDYGFAGGLDYHLSRDSVVGFALAGGGTNWSLAQSLGSGRSDAFEAGAYGVTRFGPTYLSGGLALANHWMTTNRIAFGGDQLTANFNAQSISGRVETGYRYAGMPAAGITPYAALQMQNFHTPNYSEADVAGGGFGLTYAAQNATDTRSEVGARFDDLTAINGMPVLLRGRLAWAHDWVDNPSLSAIFQALPGSGFIVNGAPLPKNSALTSAGATLFITRALSFAGKFDGEFANGAQTYAGSGTLRYQW